MYDNKNKINSVYFKKNNRKKNKKFNRFICLILIIFIFFFCFHINFKYFSKKNQNFIQNSKNDNLLPPKPKEKWKYIQKLECL